MAAVRNWLKMAWETQPVLVVSVAIGCLGESLTMAASVGLTCLVCRSGVCAFKPCNVETPS